VLYCNLVSPTHLTYHVEKLVSKFAFKSCQLVHRYAPEALTRACQQAVEVVAADEECPLGRVVCSFA
jgi:hypothetical protein